MSQDTRMIIAKNVKYYRQLNKLTREALSLSLGFENSYIGKLERGQVNITIDRLTIIANNFSVKVSDLLQ